MSNEYPGIHEKRYALGEFVEAEYRTTLPPHTGDMDIHLLYRTMERMALFLNMAQIAYGRMEKHRMDAEHAETEQVYYQALKKAEQSERNYQLWMSVRSEFEDTFCDLLYLIGDHSDKLAAARQEAREKNNVRNFEDYVQNGAGD